MKVVKFGGTSLATAEGVMRAAQIAKNADIVVVSAPGKRFDGDTKITDLLFDAYNARIECGRCDIPFKRVEERLLELGENVGVFGLKPYLDRILHDINSGESLGYAVSRGEYLSALIMRHLLSCEFIDSAQIIRFDSFGKFDFDASKAAIKSRLKGCVGAVVPGYYGSMPNGEIKVFSRGGSDITGAVIAAATGAQIYENYTDVDGVFFCPITQICQPIKTLSYAQMRRLSFFGATVLHPDSVIYSVPIAIKNTFNSSAEGTLIGRDDCKSKVAGMSARDGFRLLSFSGIGLSLSDILNRVERLGARVITALGSVDSFAVVAEGELPADLDCVAEDVALITILTSDQGYVLGKLAETGFVFKLISMHGGDSSVLAATAPSQREAILRDLCNIFKTE